MQILGGGWFGCRAWWHGWNLPVMRQKNWSIGLLGSTGLHEELPSADNIFQWYMQINKIILSTNLTFRFLSCRNEHLMFWVGLRKQSKHLARPHTRHPKHRQNVSNIKRVWPGSDWLVPARDGRVRGLKQGGQTLHRLRRPKSMTVLQNLYPYASVQNQ